jgi:hypothetical protein
MYISNNTAIAFAQIISYYLMKDVKIIHSLENNIVNKDA